MAYDPKQWMRYTTGDLYDDDSMKPRDIPPVDQVSTECSPTIIHREEEANGNIDAVVSNEDESGKLVKEIPDPRKLEFYISMLQKMIRPLPSEYKKKLSYDVICQLAHAVLDGTIFEIVKGLKDIQLITEKNLAVKRQAMLTQQKTKKSEMAKRHKETIERSNRKPHHILVLERHHADERKLYEEKANRDLSQLDQKIVLDLDQQVSDQQGTLQRAGLSMFYITNDPIDVKLQMYVLQFITKLMNS